MAWFPIIFIASVLAWGVGIFNRAVPLRNQVNEAWAGIDVQLQRCYERVPNLVATVRAYMQHESSVMERVTRLRGKPGRQVMDEIEGFRMYLDTAERDRLDRMRSPLLTPTYSSPFCPMPYALGKENYWCEGFARELLRQEPGH